MLILARLEDQLRDLKVAFDDAITNGKSFSNVKKIHLEIKQLEKAIAERRLMLGHPTSDY